MGSKSNDQGRAFEYVFINVLYEKLSKLSNVELLQDDHYKASERTSLLVDGYLKNSADVASDKIVELEPMLLECGTDKMKLFIQPDSRGEQGDVRDIVIQKENHEWEIGISLKHNHFAVKHSRLSKSIDFGDKWYHTKCSSNYWSKVNPVFDKLQKMRGNKWSDIVDKEESVYVPLLDAFVSEIQYANKRDKNMPTKMVEYLLGSYDFYKVVSLDVEKMAQINPFNLHGTLNKMTSGQKSKFIIPIAHLPKRLIHIDKLPKSTNRVE